MSKASNPRSTSTRREQLRAQQVAEAKKRQQRMRIFMVLGIVVLAAVIAIVSVVVVNDRKAKKEQAAKEQASQIIPPNALADGTGYAWTPTQVSGEVPTLTIYEDFQCPACHSVEQYFGPTINKLAEDGKVKIEYRVLTFLDTNLGNDSSERAARAAACADTVGAFKKYHDVTFAGQPEKEGVGFTDQQLRVDFAGQAGITGANLTKFQTCYDQKHTAQWVRESFQKAAATWKNSTPQIDLNHKYVVATDDQGNKILNDKGEEQEWWRVLEPTEDAWLKAIAKYGKAG